MDMSTIITQLSLQSLVNRSVCAHVMYVFALFFKLKDLQHKYFEVHIVIAVKKSRIVANLWNKSDCLIFNIFLRFFEHLSSKTVI